MPLSHILALASSSSLPHAVLAGYNTSTYRTLLATRLVATTSPPAATGPAARAKSTTATAAREATTTTTTAAAEPATATTTAAESTASTRSTTAAATATSASCATTLLLACCQRSSFGTSSDKERSGEGDRDHTAPQMRCPAAPHGLLGSSPRKPLSLSWSTRLTLRRRRLGQEALQWQQLVAADVHLVLLLER